MQKKNFLLVIGAVLFIFQAHGMNNGSSSSSSIASIIDIDEDDDNKNNLQPDHVYQASPQSNTLYNYNNNKADYILIIGEAKEEIKLRQNGNVNHHHRHQHTSSDPMDFVIDVAKSATTQIATKYTLDGLTWLRQQTWGLTEEEQVQEIQLKTVKQDSEEKLVMNQVVCLQTALMKAQIEDAPKETLKLIKNKMNEVLLKYEDIICNGANLPQGTFNYSKNKTIVPLGEKLMAIPRSDDSDSDSDDELAEDNDTSSLDNEDEFPVNQDAHRESFAGA